MHRTCRAAFGLHLDDGRDGTPDVLASECRKLVTGFRHRRRRRNGVNRRDFRASESDFGNCCVAINRYLVCHSYYSPLVCHYYSVISPLSQAQISQNTPLTVQPQICYNIPRKANKGKPMVGSLDLAERRLRQDEIKGLPPLKKLILIILYF